MAAMPYRSVATTDIIGPDYGPTATSSDGTIYVIIGESVARSDRWPRPNPADIEALCCIAEKVEQYRERDGFNGFNGPSRRSKQKPPLHKRVARRRRRTALAKHHRKVMKLAAKGVKSFPKRPAKPRG